MEKDRAELFSERDRSLIEASNYDPSLKPNYNPLSSLLFWDDEQPHDLSPPAYHVLNALWLARAFLYYGYELPSDLLHPEYFRSVWDKAVASKLKWPGFNRLSLSEEDRQYYLDELNRERPEGI
ncbi:MAG TPA: hypothetical protein V6C69_13260 [Trichormus sp.]|jgi:hypothetical protein